MNTKLLAIALIASSVFAAAAVPAQAYVLGTTAGWPSSPVSYYVNPSGSSLPADQTISGVVSGFNAWNQVGTKYQTKYAGTTSAKTKAYDGKNNTFFNYLPDQGYIATTQSWWYTGGAIVDSDIEWNTRYPQYTLASMNCTDGFYLESVSAHESGHFAGILHSDVGTATMYPTSNWCDSGLASLDQDDINGLKAMYGGTVTQPSPTPSPAPTPTPVPHIVLNPQSLSFSAQAGAVPAAKSVTISNTGSATLNWTASANQSWCHVGSASGSVAVGSSVPVSVWVDSYSVAGNYSCIVAVSDPNADNGTQYLSVSYTIAAAPALPPADDFTPPSIVINAPTDGSAIGNGSIAFSATGIDSSGIATIQLYMDGRLIGSCSNVSTCSAGIKGNKTARGTHALTAVVKDKAGNQAQKSITVVKR